MEELSLKSLLVLISQAILFIGSNPELMQHMAEAVEILVVANFGHRTKVTWGFYGESHTVIQKNVNVFLVFEGGTMIAE